MTAIASPPSNEAELPALEYDEFATFMKAVHGHKPYRWQLDLLEAIADPGDREVTVLAPPGLGKTAIVDCWLFDLAVQATLSPIDRHARTRLISMVNRRLVVDATYDRASKVASRLDNAFEDPSNHDRVVVAVAQRLAHIGGYGVNDLGAPTQPMRTLRMHAATSWASVWLRHPQQPTAIAATPDQAISRLLFRGYGTSRRLAPIDAALVGSDTLLVVDESHLSAAVITTIRTVVRRQQAAEMQVVRVPRLVTMTATPRPNSATDVDCNTAVEIDAIRVADSAAAVRVDAQRDLQLLKVPARESGVGKILADVAIRTADDHQLPVMAVICNTVATARKVFKQLQEHGRDARLLIGPVRGHDQQNVVADTVDGAIRHPERPDRAVDQSETRFIVSTQTIEVGVDIDVDGLITEACPYDSFKQRVGRLDRAGYRHANGLASPGVYVFCPDVHETKHGAPVYGTATATTFHLLTRYFAARTETTQPRDETVSLSWRDLAKFESTYAEQLGAATSAVPFCPVPPWGQLDDWSRTSPLDRQDADVAPFIHGLELDPLPTVRVIWRADVERIDDPSQVERSLTTLPATRDEEINLPLPTVRRWLEHDDGAEDADDLPDLTSQYRWPLETSRKASTQVAVHTPEGQTILRFVRDLSPNDLLVIPSSHGGHDRWGFDPHHTGTVPDVADQVHGHLRLIPATLRHHGVVVDQELSGVNDPDLHLIEARHLLATATESPSPIQRLAYEVSRTGRIELLEHDDGQVTAVARPLAGSPLASPADDDSSSHTRRTDLDTHLRNVADSARLSGQRIGLPNKLVDAVATAGLFHDAGKTDLRFQAWLNGGRLPNKPFTLLAKSGMTSRAERERARKIARWPKGGRHETISLVLYYTWRRRRPELSHLDHQLIEHLIATHHGYHRPLPPVLPHARFEEVRASIDGTECTASANDLREEAIGWTGAMRMDHLTSRYGPWGLAALETVVRLADYDCSHHGR